MTSPTDQHSETGLPLSRFIGRDSQLREQLVALADIRETTLGEEIRKALEMHIKVARSDPEFIARAVAMCDRIARDASNRILSTTRAFDLPEPDGLGDIEDAPPGSVSYLHSV